MELESGTNTDHDNTLNAGKQMMGGYDQTLPPVMPTDTSIGYDHNHPDIEQTRPVSHQHQEEHTSVNSGYGYDQPMHVCWSPEYGYNQPMPVDCSPEYGYNQPMPVGWSPEYGYNQPMPEDWSLECGYNQPMPVDWSPECGYNQPGIHQPPYELAHMFRPSVEHTSPNNEPSENPQYQRTLQYHVSGGATSVQDSTQSAGVDPSNRITYVIEEPYSEERENRKAALTMIMFSCIITWVFCLCIGLCAFGFAVESCYSRRPAVAKDHRKTAMWLNISGFIMGLIFWAVGITFVVLMVIHAKHAEHAEP